MPAMRMESIATQRLLYWCPSIPLANSTREFGRMFTDAPGYPPSASKMGYRNGITENLKIAVSD